MKCPNCGAEIENSKVCDFCGSQITTEMQRQQELLNKKGCPKCGSSNITFNREKRGEVKGKSGTAVVRATVGLCKDCGYTWYTDESYQVPKKRKTWLWVLGWLFIFPVPLTILMLRNKNIKPAIKYGIIAVAWIVYLIIGLGGQSNKDGKHTTGTTPKAEQTGTTEKHASEYDIVDSFVRQYNAIANRQFNGGTEINIQDKEYYRTEFRLGAYKNAKAKKYTVDSEQIIIINYGSMKNDSIRMYLTTDNDEIALDVFDAAVKVLDKTLTSSDITEANQNILSRKNGNYMGDISYYYFGKPEGLFIDCTNIDFHEKN